MNTSAIYHRPESEFAYLYTPNKMRIRLRTAKDIKYVGIIKGDHYNHASEKWYLKNTPMKKTLSTALHDYWEIETEALYQRLSYGFYVKGEDELELFYCDQGVFPFDEQYLAADNLYFRMPYFQEIDMFKAPDWAAKTVWYQIFPERFANGDPTNDPAGTLPWGSKLPGREDFFGGDLQGIIDHLDYLSQLGITGIYLCPIFKAPSNHKYDTVDYFEIDPAFGDKKLFKELVQKAHKRGMKIMLDAVFNHLGASSSQWQDVIKNGAQSKYADWFHIHSFPVHFDETDDPELASNINYDTFSFVPNMPKLNTANPEVQAYLLEIATYWIKEFDIDAWRLDVANEVDHHFWKAFRKAVLSIKSDLYILGEIWHSSQRWLEGDEFHAVMNYAFTDNIKAYFVEKKITPSGMVSGMNNQMMLYRDQANEVTFNLLDSHDTPRILTLCDGNQDLMRVTLAFMFLQKGAPCIYYGTEIGMQGGMDPDCRRCMRWDAQNQDPELLSFTQSLIQFRKQYADIFAYGTTEWVTVDDDKQLVVLKRSYNGTDIVAYFNQANENHYMKIDTPIYVQQNVTKLNEQQFSINQHGFLIQVMETQQEV